MVIALSATVLVTSAVALALHSIPRISGMPSVPAVRTALSLTSFSSDTDSVEPTDAEMSQDPSSTQSAVPDTLQPIPPSDALAPANPGVVVAQTVSDPQREVIVPEPYETLDDPMDGGCDGGTTDTGTKPTGDRH
ncbi:MAG: hypothetical protein Q7J82_00155 [Coriobacteriia bacterium]|nr:hypothetical protein [Coriobacteriia bacterium]